MSVSKSSPWSSRAGRRGAALLLSLLLGSPALADGPLDTLQVHGFLSQALLFSDHNNFFGPSSRHRGSAEYTELGANVSLRPRADLLVAAQVLSRRAGGDTEDARPALDYGVLDYQALANQRRTLGVQLGRFKTPFGFYNQTRDVAFTRPGVLLPQSLYFDRTRSLALAADGASLYWDEHLSHGTLRTQLGVGRSQADDDLRRTLGLARVPGRMEGRPSFVGQLRYEHASGGFAAALSAAAVKARFDSPVVGRGDFQFTPWVLSLQYTAERWSLTAEYALRVSSLDGLAAPLRDFDITGESGYVQYTRRFADRWQWLVRYDRLISDRDDPRGRAYAAATGLPAHSRFAEDLTFGLQWTPRPWLLLGAELHHVDGTGWLPSQDNPDPDATRRRWNLLLFQLSLRF